MDATWFTLEVIAFVLAVVFHIASQAVAEGLIRSFKRLISWRSKNDGPRI